MTEAIIGAAIEVHRVLGPGLLESAYQPCLGLELREIGLRFRQQVPLSLLYHGHRIENVYRLDFLVEKKVVVEIKSVRGLDPVHAAQMITYLKLSGCGLGLLINFNSRLLKHGIRRFRV